MKIVRKVQDKRDSFPAFVEDFCALNNSFSSSFERELSLNLPSLAKGFRAPGTATQAAGDRHEAKGTENIVIELETYGAPPFLAAGGAIKHTACGKSTVKTESKSLF